jgi:hypothetical protein
MQPARHLASRHFRLRPPWPGAATRDENRGTPGQARLSVLQSPLVRAIFVSVEVSCGDVAWARKCGRVARRRRCVLGRWRP